MLFFLVVIICIAIGFVLMKLDKPTYDSPPLWEIGVFIATIASLVFAFLIVIVLVNNVAQGTQPNLTKLDARRAHICDMMERVADGGYENVSAIEVGNMIVEWNDECNRAYHWNNNLWFNWFWNDKRVEHLIPIMENYE